MWLKLATIMKRSSGRTEAPSPEFMIVSGSGQIAPKTAHDHESAL
jgi:hypothetical protein